MKMLLLVLMFLLASAIGSRVTYFLFTPIWDYQPRVNYQTLPFPELDATIYMSARAWGLTGDHEEVRLCNTPIDFRTPLNSNNCLVFYTNEMFYQKNALNKLRIRVNSSSIPRDQQNQLGPIRVEIDELKHGDQIKNLELNYDKFGLYSIAAP
jgi:hypothetical protein